jgi:flagellar L-ring protein precursor FlgH
LDGPSQPAALLYDARRARNVGDIVYVLISESFKGTGKASTNSDGSHSSSYAIPAFLGHHNLFDVFGGDADMNKLIEAKRSTNTKGDGATSRSNTLSARVAARVVEVLPNDNYRIEASHYTKVNGEEHFVTLTGIIKGSDITANNTISSVLIADSNINYGGYGPLGSKQRIGWATRILDVVWPF